MIEIRCVYASFYLYQNSTGLISVFGVFAFSGQFLPQMHWHLLSFDLFYKKFRWGYVVFNLSIPFSSFTGYKSRSRTFPGLISTHPSWMDGCLRRHESARSGCPAGRLPGVEYIINSAP
jgi:hypothetical protein